jgi:TPR repeat protein
VEESDEQGKGVKENKVAAFTWYKKAADRDHIKAQRRVAECYMNGSGTENSPTEAFKILIK